jgi:DUF1680 family protein
MMEHIVKRILPLSLVAILFLMPQPGRTEEPKHRKLSAVPFTAVKVQDEFWAPRIRKNREVSLPHNFKWCEQTGRISNFAKAGKLMEGKFEGIFFNDSDVYKVLEGASYSLADQPDAAMEKIVDDVIAKIASAQQPNGYLSTYFTLVEPDKRWTDFGSKHELYCAGHMIEGAVAHYRATGKRTFLDVAQKLADHLEQTFGPDKRHEVPGHEEVELALVKLYQVTGQEKYLKLAKFFLDIRGDKTQRKQLFGEYCQDHLPVREQSEIVGHAVRAMYLYSGVADVAAYTGDQGFIGAMHRLWDDVVRHKMYITGGVGARHAGEAFGDRYELPNETAYCETCAAIGLAFWAHRLNLMHADAQYADVLEQALYNGILSGIALDGEHFFYVNPLASGGNHHRQPFFGCACCPSNVVRLVPSVPGYVYAQGSDGVYVNLYTAGVGEIQFGDQKVKMTQVTRYPWDGDVKLLLEMPRPATMAVYLRIPGWCQGAKITVNGKDPGPCLIGKGYARLHRDWKNADQIELTLPMPIQRMEAHPQVAADRGRVAIQRGPVVYCFEKADNPEGVRNLVLPVDPKLTAEHRSDLLGGVTVIKGVDRKGRQIVAVPYYAWDHREPGEMAVWVRQDGKSRKPEVKDPSWEGKLYRPLDPSTLGPSEPPTLDDMTTASASHTSGIDSLSALNDHLEPRNSCDHDVPRFTWWDHKGTKEWVQYDFEMPQKISSVAVYWFDDGRIKRHCRAPKAWKLLFKDGDAWKPVSGASAYGVELDKYNRVTFEPVQTKALRLEIELNPPWSGGILEWKLEQ